MGYLKILVQEMNFGYLLLVVRTKNALNKESYAKTKLEFNRSRSYGFICLEKADFTSLFNFFYIYCKNAYIEYDAP